jgi:hypothetical protein
MFPMSKTALVVAARLIQRRDRPKYLQLIEQRAKEHHASQIGANHVLEVVLESKYYRQLGAGLQGGPGSGPTDPPGDTEIEWEALLSAPEPDDAWVLEIPAP